MKNIRPVALLAVIIFSACAPPPDPKEPERAALRQEMEAFWQEAQKAIPAEPEELRLEINTGGTFTEVMDQTRATVDHFEEMLKLINPGGQGPNWEVLNLGVPNHLKTLRIELALLDVKRAEEKLLADPEDAAARGRLDRAKEQLLKLAAEARAAD